MPIEEGTVVSATLRPEDLVPAFLEEMERLGLDTAGYRERASGLDFETEEALFLLDELFDALNRAAPEGLYFGAHIGDGSDFGWWREDYL